MDFSEFVNTAVPRPTALGNTGIEVNQDMTINHQFPQNILCKGWKIPSSPQTSKAHKKNHGLVALPHVKTPELITHHSMEMNISRHLSFMIHSRSSVLMVMRAPSPICIILSQFTYFNRNSKYYQTRQIGVGPRTNFQQIGTNDME